MAKRRSPSNQIEKQVQLPEYGELIDIMTNETASIINDYIRQYVGVLPDRAIFLNKDRVLTTQSYMELAWYNLYAEVERDPHVGSVLDSAKINVAGLPWTVDPFLLKGQKKATKRNEEIAEFLKDVLENSGHTDTTQGIVSGFPQHIYNWMGALGMGFAVSEAIYTDSQSWADEGVRIKTFLNRDPRRFQFAVDRSLRLRTIGDPYYGEKLPEKKFIVHRCSATWENPFGDALDQSLYWMWLFKRTVIKFWTQHLQVGAASVPIVQHPAGANKEFKAEALEIAKMIRNGAYGRIPENFKVTYAEAQKGADNAAAYQNFIRTMDDQISKRVNGQTLTAEASSGTGTGSRALGEVHQGTQSSRDLFRAKGFEATINSSVIKWVTDYNFASVDGYPRFRFDIEDPEDLVQESQIVKNLTDAGFEFDETEVSEKFNYTVKRKQPLNLKPVNPLEQPEEMKPELEQEEDDAEGQVATA